MNPRDGTKTPAAKGRDPKVVMAEISEDFMRIQIVDNDLGLGDLRVRPVESGVRHSVHR